jgi:hypothetical protein
MTAGDIITIKGSTNSRKAAAFDGTDDYILADAHAVARVAGNDTTGTYSAWINVDNVGAGVYSFLSIGDNDSATEYFWITEEAGKIKVRLYHGGAVKWQVDTTNIVMSDRKWTHVAVVQNGTQPKIYIGGELAVTTNTTATDLTYWYDELTGCDKFAIGVKESNNTHTQDFPGMISDVKYWNIALNPAEVLQDKLGETLTKDAVYLQLHLLKGDFGITDQGLGADNGTLTGHAYLCGEGSEWSRRLDGKAVEDDNINTITYPGGAMTTIVKAA